MPPSRNSLGGVSRRCIVHVGGGGKAKTLRAGAIHERQQDARELRSALLKKLPLVERERLLSAESGGPSMSSQGPSDNFDLTDFSAYFMDVDSMVPPPGEEGFSVSHAGDEISLYRELETITMTKTRRLDTRDRSGRIARLVAEWASQYNDLTNAFLTYKENCTPPPISDNEAENFSIEVVDLFERRVQTFRSLSPFINVSLLRNGCIGSSPTRPTVAITIRTLDVFRQSHRVCPRFSIHAAAKMLCFMHNLCYRRHLAEQMRTAFDVYLEIHRRINSRLDKFLGRDTENWRMLNSCPACQYKLDNEPTLDFSILCACDGNNSAKLVDPAVRSESYVDQFKDEVRSARAHQARQPARQQPSDPDDPWIDEPDSNDSAEPPTICVDRWRNAAPESRKKMFAIFKKSGIFVTVCRHGFLLTICDMVRSGELMKYPIASVKKLMDVFGSNILYGYDIKCAFEKIIQRSSLADDAKRLNLQGVVPAFHGHAHNRLCQVEHHSKYKVGAGKEDFETCERVFSESNALAAQIRNATDFHRHQALDEHFSFADLDKFAALSDFIYNNYVQALTIISTTNIFLTNFHASNAAIKPNFEDNLKDEHQVLQRLARKKEESTVEVDYVRALNEYDEAQRLYESAHVAFSGLDLRLNYSTKESGDIRRRHANATNKRDQKLDIVMHYEHQMALDSRWGPDHPERMKAQSRITNRLFHKAVDDVERLVVMRLLELTKLQMSGLGYKLRTQISKALKSRANAIRNALTRYNKYGALLSPPRPPLQWDQIVEYSFLAEFDLLRETDGEIQSKNWANPSYRHASTQYFEHQRANEEIRRLNVELGRLLTKMRDDAIDYPHAIAQLQSSDPPLAAELQRRWTQLRSVNARHIWRIQQIMQLPGYSGPKTPGSRVGRIDVACASPYEAVPHEQDREEGDGDDVELGQQLEDVQAYIEGLAHHRVDLESAE